MWASTVPGVKLRQQPTVPPFMMAGSVIMLRAAMWNSGRTTKRHLVGGQLVSIITLMQFHVMLAWLSVDALWAGRWCPTCR